MTPDQAPSTPQDRERATMHRIAFQLVKSSLIDWVNGVRLTPSEADWDQVWVLENFFPSSWFYSILEHLVLNREDISPEIPSSLVSKPNLVQKFRKIFKLHNQNLVLSDFSTIATHLSLKKSPFSQKRLFTGEHFLNPNHVHGSKWRQNSAEMTVLKLGRGGGGNFHREKSCSYLIERGEGLAWKGSRPPWPRISQLRPRPAPPCTTRCPASRPPWREGARYSHLISPLCSPLSCWGSGLRPSRYGQYLKSILLSFLQPRLTSTAVQTQDN